MSSQHESNTECDGDELDDDLKGSHGLKGAKGCKEESEKKKSHCTAAEMKREKVHVTFFSWSLF